MDVLSLQKALDKFNDETLPRLESIINEDLAKLIDDLNSVLDRLDGTRANVTISIPPRGSLKG